MTLQQAQWQLEKAQQKQTQLLQKGHLASHYFEYLPSELQTAEHVEAWLAMIGKKSRFRFQESFQKVQDLKRKITILEAELTFLTQE